MFNQLKDKQKVYVELTNPIHGGPGWEFGTCLWSPEKSKDGKDAWGIMRNVQKGDIILHSLKRNHGHCFVGISRVKDKYNVIEFEPTSAGRWSGMGNYYRIELEEYNTFTKEIPMIDFLSIYKDRLSNEKNSFFTIEYQPAQKYLAEVSLTTYQNLIDFFTSVFNEKGSENIIEDETNSNVVNDESKANDGNLEPEKKVFNITRTIRDTKIIKKLKVDTNNVCQICGKSIILSNGKSYSEGHHLKPLGGAHNGPDIRGNVIILCPNHHTEFDYGSIAIKPRTNKIVHANEKDEFHNKKLQYIRSDMNLEFIRYHYKNIFKKLK